MLGIIAIVYYKKLSPQPAVFPFYSVYSPHSWLGIAVLVLWGIQLSVAVCIYGFCKRTPEQNLRQLVKFHKFLGKTIYITGLATCALGLQDMQSSDLASSTPPLPGVCDTLGMGAGGSVTVGNITLNVTGYCPTSPEAQYASAGTILLMLLGISTFAALVV